MQLKHSIQLNRTKSHLSFAHKERQNNAAVFELKFNQENFTIAKEAAVLAELRRFSICQSYYFAWFTSTAFFFAYLNEAFL